MRVGRVFFVLAVFLCSFVLLAQEPPEPPNFTGVWKIDLHRSTFDRQPPDSATLYIHQNDPDFHLRLTEVRQRKSSAWSVHGRTDGKVLDFKSRDGNKRTQMYWQGSQLVLEWQAKDKHGETRKVMRLSLADGGKTLLATETENGHENKWVFYKSR